MRHIDRLPVPEILFAKQKEWQQKYDEKRKGSPHCRPDSSKYAHRSIVDQLWSMSSGKCFYCETKLSGEPREVDHFIEVACDPSKAYEWDNLYLSCSNCNNKLSDSTISVECVLDPCGDSDEVIRNNITFEDEIICPVANSCKGLDTIRKYSLDSEALDYKRAKWLIKLSKVIIRIEAAMRADSRKELTDEERRCLLGFTQPSSPYSLMCSVYLEKIFSAPDFVFRSK